LGLRINVITTDVTAPDDYIQKFFPDFPILKVSKNFKFIDLLRKVLKFIKILSNDGKAISLIIFSKGCLKMTRR
jgi:hypothetical protein